MKNQPITQATLHCFTYRVELLAQLFMLVSMILNKIHCSVITTKNTFSLPPLFRRFPTFLPSIHLYNQKQTKLFAFVII